MNYLKMGFMYLLVSFFTFSPQIATCDRPKIDPDSKQFSSVSWRFFENDKEIAYPVSGTASSVRCSVIASEDEGDWVTLFIDCSSLVRITLLDAKSDRVEMRPILGRKPADKEPFKLKSRLCPKHEVAQAVVFEYTPESRIEQKVGTLRVKPDGSVCIEITSGQRQAIWQLSELKLTGSVSATWFVPK